MPVRTLSASLEDYLEAILHIVSARKVARPRDIARRLGVGNSSVTGALRALADKGMIEYAPYDFVTLTREGQRRAGEIARRHGSLHDFLIKVLGLDEAAANTVACGMEHALPRAVSERLIEFVEFVERCPRWGETGTHGFRSCGGKAPESDQCEACLNACLDAFRSRRDGAAHPEDGDSHSRGNDEEGDGRGAVDQPTGRHR